MNGGLVLARFVHFAATMSLFGGYLFAAALAPPTLRPDLAPFLRRFGPPLALLCLFSALLWLVVLAREMAEGALDFDVLGDVLSGTAFGRVWQARLAILALLLAATVWPDRRGLAPAALAGLAIATLGLVGHATMQDGVLGAAHRANHALHLLATSFWLGGLPLFLVALARFRKRPERRDALEALMRYSRVGHFAVAAVFLSGGLDVAMTSHALPWPPTTPWRLGLDAKIAVFCVMTALALVNRYVFAPRVSRQSTAAKALAAGAVAEVALGLAAVALVSAFATQNPA
jgi:putative copper resistance protein D